jgi:hypothetical protein
MSPFIKRSRLRKLQMEMDPKLIKTDQARRIIKEFFDKKAAAILHEANSGSTSLKARFDVAPGASLPVPAVF